MTSSVDERITQSSGNVFRDLGRPDADLLVVKAQLTALISEAISVRGLTQARAAEVLGVDQPRVSHLVRGHLSDFSLDTLIGYLKRLDVKVSLALEDPINPSHEQVLVAV